MTPGFYVSAARMKTVFGCELSVGKAALKNHVVAANLLVPDIEPFETKKIFSLLVMILSYNSLRAVPNYLTFRSLSDNQAHYYPAVMTVEKLSTLDAILNVKHIKK